MCNAILAPLNGTCIDCNSKTCKASVMYVQISGRAYGKTLALNTATKERVLDDLYRTGRIEGKYFGKVSKNTINPVRAYIEACLWRCRLPFDADLVDDCYNEGFLHLAKIEAAEFVAMYSESPGKVIATLLKIIRLKCFAVDPRYGNPKHSLVQGILFTSSFNGAAEIKSSDEYDIDNTPESNFGQFVNEHYYTPIQNDEEPDEFEQKFGFSIETILERLTTRERRTFYAMLGKQPRGKASAIKLSERARLSLKLLRIKAELEAMEGEV